jgi:hypothetical protein
MFETAKDRVMLELRQKVRVEFLNRFDKIIVFAPHDIENLTQISILLLKELKARLADKNITVKWEDNVPRIIATRAYEPGLGARPLRRYIQEKVEGVLATKMLRQEIQPGDNFNITSDIFPKEQSTSQQTSQATPIPQSSQLPKQSQRVQSSESPQNINDLPKIQTSSSSNITPSANNPTTPPDSVPNTLTS